MKRLPTAVLFTALLPPLVLLSPAAAQVPRGAATPSASQAERKAVELRPGMTLAEVEKLLGKPKRTALKGAGNFPSDGAHGTLQWTYAWSADHILQVVFTSKAREEWLVTSWDWSNY